MLRILLQISSIKHMILLVVAAMLMTSIALLAGVTIGGFPISYKVVRFFAIINLVAYLILLFTPLTSVFEEFRKETETMRAKYLNTLSQELKEIENQCDCAKRRVTIINELIIEKEQQFQRTINDLTNEVNKLQGIRELAVKTLSSSVLRLEKQLADISATANQGASQELISLTAKCKELSEALTLVQKNEISDICGRDIISLDKGTISKLNMLSQHTRLLGKFLICILEERITDAYSLLDDQLNSTSNDSGTFTKQEKLPKTRGSKGGKKVSMKSSQKMTTSRVINSKGLSL